jgi:MFS transporter, ACS family, tartrate transporter
MTDSSPSPARTFADRLMGLFWRKPPSDLGERTRRRVVVHLIPYLFFLYILAYLDRANISVAELDMKRPPDEGGLGISATEYGIAFGAFFWGYWILEVPSTVSVLRWGARWVFVRILVLWGLACMLIGAVGTPLGNRLLGWLPAFHEDPAISQLYFLRFMLGFFEGGFFPSVIVYLTLWFRPQDRAKAIATFMSAIPVSLAMGSPLSGALLDVNWLNLPGWRWIFILQGFVPVLAGIATIFFLPDRPERAAWLPPEERGWLLGELHREHAARKGHGHMAWLGQASNVLLLTGYYFCMNVTSYGLTSFLPKIIQAQTGLPKFWVTVLVGVAYLMALVAMLINGWHSDKTGERIRHVLIPLTCLSLSIFLTALLDGMWIWPVLTMMFLVGTFLYAHLPAFWPIPSMFLGATAAASAIGFINMIGNLGGSVGSIMMGKASEGRTSFALALFLLAPFPLVSAAIILFVAYLRRDVLARKS